MTPEERADWVHEQMLKCHGVPLGDGGPQFVAQMIREAVAEERAAWLGAVVFDETGSGSWQEAQFGPWRSLLTGDRFRTREVAEADALTAAARIREGK